MTTGYNIRAGSLMLAERIGGYGVFDALGECYALRDTKEEADEAAVQGEWYLHEASTCGHRLAEGWARQRRPLRVRLVSVDERAAVLEDGVPVLDREP